jgi:MOSC domain-containing protein YiiM
MTTLTILELRTGRAEPFGPTGELSAIDKRPTDRPLHVTAEGLEGDEQGDRRHHGGPDKALHAYALVHYRTWPMNSQTWQTCYALELSARTSSSTV